MINWIKSLFGYEEYQKLGGAVRSSKWSSVRKEFLQKNPSCAICGKTKKIVPHHKKPFHLFPELELEVNNLTTLCESNGMNCHITFGHIGNWKNYNSDIIEDITIWKQKIEA